MEKERMVVSGSDLSFKGAGDAGATFEFKCPDCGDDITVAEYPYWSTLCSCMHRWYLNLSAEVE